MVNGPLQRSRAEITRAVSRFCLAASLARRFFCNNWIIAVEAERPASGAAKQRRSKREIVSILLISTLLAEGGCCRKFDRGDKIRKKCVNGILPAKEMILGAFLCFTDKLRERIRKFRKVLSFPCVHLLGTTSHGLRRCGDQMSEGFSTPKYDFEPCDHRSGRFFHARNC